MKINTFNIETAHSPIWATPEESAVNLMVKFNEFRNEIPFTATRDDVEPHGRKLFKRAIAGEFGPIAASKQTTSPEGA